ncbi:MAG TPA: hypothetical protein DCG49_00265 [Ruminococcus sp.]|nr:hypothetical protein [Ruminococcus sp.]
MVCIHISGMTLAADFTAPALLAFLALLLPPQALLQTVLACVLHESAHFLAIAATGQMPSLLRISAAGLHLELQGASLCPTGAYCRILAAGAFANIAAAIGFQLAGIPEPAAANLSLGLFNLLPFRSTDGGTMLHLLLERRFYSTKPELPARIMRFIAFTAACLLGILLRKAKISSPSVWGMLIFMFLSDMLNRSDG